MDPYSAANKVLATTKLLESIMNHLPPHSILPLRSVNRKFDAVVESSSILQKKLVFSTFSTYEWLHFSNSNPTRRLIRDMLDCTMHLKRRAWLYSNASWRHLQLSFPPGTELALRFYAPERKYDDKQVINVAHGIQLGSLFERMARYTLQQQTRRSHGNVKVIVIASTYKLCMEWRFDF